ncbi:hypothetical protein ACFPTO_17575 [Paraburkholderia denitrificans]|uniref:Lipoprotein n=1 Tax=Paraburkholderia denitrificans TaxID=694025 RepID=A0ABW0JBY0_9BURK
MNGRTLCRLALVLAAITVSGAASADHPHFHGGHPGFHHSHVRVFIGSGFAFGSPYPFGYPAYYPPEVVAVPTSPPEYIEQADDVAPQDYWYRCNQPEGYYPYVQACPGGWLTVPAQPPARN